MPRSMKARCSDRCTGSSSIYSASALAAKEFPKLEELADTLNSFGPWEGVLNKKRIKIEKGNPWSFKNEIWVDGYGVLSSNIKVGLLNCRIKFFSKYGKMDNRFFIKLQSGTHVDNLASILAEWATQNKELPRVRFSKSEMDSMDGLHLEFSLENEKHLRSVLSMRELKGVQGKFTDALKIVLRNLFKTKGGMVDPDELIPLIPKDLPEEQFAFIVRLINETAGDEI